MKYVKMLGLAAVAAAALMAFVGASTASATVLCKTTGGTTCPANQAYPAGTEIHAINVGNVTLTTTFKNIVCEESTVTGSTDNEGGASETVVGSISELTFPNAKCNCEVKVLAKGKLEIHWIEGTDNGTLTAKEQEITAECSTIIGKVHCIYATGAGTHIGVFTGGADPVMHAEENNIPRLATSSACAEKAHWDATYTVTSPQPIYVAGHT
jgi:hypothetical protein